MAAVAVREPRTIALIVLMWGVLHHAVVVPVLPASKATPQTRPLLGGTARVHPQTSLRSDVGTSPNSTVVVLMARLMTKALRLRHAALLDAGLDAHIVLEAAYEARPGLSRRDHGAAASPPPPPVLAKLGPREHHSPTHIVAAAGFSDLISRMGSRRISAWDRALYWCHSQRVRFCWLVEDDVLWDTPGALRSIVAAFADEPAGLVAHSLQEHTDNPGAWAHRDACLSVLGPSAAGVVPAFCPLSRVSGALLDALGTLGRSKGRLCFLEALLPAVAAREGLGVVHFDAPPVRPGLPRFAMRYRPPFTAAELAVHAFNVYHPVKSLQQQGLPRWQAAQPQPP
jgi:hypothetical protein